MDGRANPLMDRNVVEALSLSLSNSVTFSLYLSISPSVYLFVDLSICSVDVVVVVFIV